MVRRTSHELTNKMHNSESLFCFGADLIRSHAQNLGHQKPVDHFPVRLTAEEIARQKRDHEEQIFVCRSEEEGCK
jgi:hypothetical protein